MFLPQHYDFLFIRYLGKTRSNLGKNFFASPKVATSVHLCSSLVLTLKSSKCSLL